MKTIEIKNEDIYKLFDKNDIIKISENIFSENNDYIEIKNIKFNINKDDITYNDIIENVNINTFKFYYFVKTLKEYKLHENFSNFFKDKFPSIKVIITCDIKRLIKDIKSFKNLIDIDLLYLIEDNIIDDVDILNIVSMLSENIITITNFYDFDTELKRLLDLCNNNLSNDYKGFTYKIDSNTYTILLDKQPYCTFNIRKINISLEDEFDNLGKIPKMEYQGKPHNIEYIKQNIEQLK